MGALLRLSALIDRLNELVGRTLYWLILAMVLISAANATSRKFLNASSNAWLELQWYLFSVVFCAARRLYPEAQRTCPGRSLFYPSTLSRRGQLWIDILGTLVFLLPTLRRSWPG